MTLRDVHPCKGVIPTPMFEFFRRVDVVEHLFGDRSVIDPAGERFCPGDVMTRPL
jgi:hypothetical protein